MLKLPEGTILQPGLYLISDGSLNCGTQCVVADARFSDHTKIREAVDDAIEAFCERLKADMEPIYLDQITINPLGPPLPISLTWS